MRQASWRPLRPSSPPDFWHEHGPSESARLHSRRSSMGMHGLGTAASMVSPASAAGVAGLPARNTVLRAPALPTPATHFWGQVPSLLATVPRKRPAPNSDHSPIFVFRTLGGRRSSLRARLKVAYVGQTSPLLCHRVGSERMFLRPSMALGCSGLRGLAVLPLSPFGALSPDSPPGMKPARAEVHALDEPSRQWKAMRKGF